MADQEPKIQFEIDIADTLAKLHLGGVSTDGSSNEDGKKPKIDPSVLFFNSGIIGYKQNDSPSKPGNTKFDMSNSSGKYEVGVMFTKPLKVTLKHTQDDINQANGKEAGIGEKTEENAEARPSSAAGQRMVDDNQNAIEEAEVKQYRKPALEFLKAYMAAFAGKDAASKIKDADMVRITLPKDTFPWKVKYDNFKIPSVTDKEVQKMSGKNGVFSGLQNNMTGIGGIITSEQKGDSKDIEIKNICYKIGYTLDVKA